MNSHYIPQLILRHFCTNNEITYCNMQNRKVEMRNTKSVFTENGYYPDELERSLCEKIERQFADLLNNNILNSHKKLILSEDEMLVLKKFLLITIFRYRTKERKEFELYPLNSEQDKEMYMGGFFENISKILECKTKTEIFDYIDYNNVSTNLTLTSYIRDILYSYTVFVSTDRSDEDFVIPDNGYASYEGSVKVKKLNAVLDLAKKTRDPLLFQIASMLTPHDYSIFPLSYNIAVLTMSTFFKLCLKNSPYNIIYPIETPTLSTTLGFGNREIIEAPKLRVQPDKGMVYICEIKPLKIEDVTFLNSLLLANVDQYFACADILRIQQTIESLQDTIDLTFLKRSDK